MTQENLDSGSEQEFTAADSRELQEILARNPDVDEQRFEFPGGEIVRVDPPRHRLDEATGEPVIPLLYVQGAGNMDKSTSWYAKALAELDGRPVIAVRYTERFDDKATPQESDGATVTALDLAQVENLISALDTFDDIGQVDAAGISRGGGLLIEAAYRYPERFRDIRVDHPMGLDDRSFRQSHMDALRERVARAYRRNKPQTPDSVAAEKKPTRWDQIRNSRAQQKSVAYADLDGWLSKIDPSVHVHVTADVSDKAFRPDRVRASAEQAAEAGASVTYSETDWGGHGYHYDVREQREIVEGLRGMEKDRLAA